MRCQNIHIRRRGEKEKNNMRNKYTSASGVWAEKERAQKMGIESCVALLFDPRGKNVWIFGCGNCEIRRNCLLRHSRMHLGSISSWKWSKMGSFWAAHVVSSDETQCFLAFNFFNSYFFYISFFVFVSLIKHTAVTLKWAFALKTE